MATNQGTRLALTPRDTSGGSRATRRLRRTGQVPGVLYGGEGEPVSFTVDARELRHALAARGAVLELAIDGSSTPAVLKDAHYHPVRGETLHVDFLRVRLDVAIHATVLLDLVGAEDAPGVKEGGVLEQVSHQLNIEALPTAIPEAIVVDVSGMEIAATMHLSEITAPEGVEFLDDPEETIIATVVVPTEVEEPEEIEEETELIGEDGEPIEAPDEEGEESAGEGDAAASEEAEESE